MSSSVPIGSGDVTAPTPVNTPLNAAPISSGLSRPTVPDITEDNEPVEDEGGDGADALSSAMIGMVHGKLAGLVGKSSGYVENLPVEVKRNVEALKGVQVKYIELHNKYKLECYELEKKYLELQKPLFERRNAIVSGKEQPTAEEIEAGEKETLKDDEDYKPLPKDVAESKDGIPEFWLTALRNHIALSDLITERDVDALKHLTDITLEYFYEDDGRPGFRLLFHFSPNDFFENSVLQKSYIYQKEVGYSGDFIYDRAIGCEIQWKGDKDLTKEFEIRKQRNKNTNRTRLVRKARPVDSFFNFFTPPVPLTDEQIENNELSDEEIEELEEKLEMDYQLGEDFKEKIIPRAVDYFTGKALEYDGLDEDDDDDYDDEDDLEDDDGFDDEDSDLEPELPARRRGPPKGRGGVPAAGNNVNPEECKQQ